MGNLGGLILIHSEAGVLFELKFLLYFPEVNLYPVINACLALCVHSLVFEPLND